MYRRGASFISALGIAAIACLAAAAPGTAAQAPKPTDVIGLSWNGKEYTSVIGGSFVGVPVSVPGDSAERTLLVRNDGPSTGTLSATIVNVKILDPDAQDEGNFYDDLRLGWDGGSSNFTDLASRTETPIYEMPVAPGAVVPITIDYQFPLEATSGNKANVSKREASFDVRLAISGESDPTLPGTETTAPPSDQGEPSLPGTDTTPPDPNLPGTETAVPPAGPSGDGDDSGDEPRETLKGKEETKQPLAKTGANIWGVVAAGLGLLGLGALFSVRGRRKGKHSN